MFLQRGDLNTGSVVASDFPKILPSPACEKRYDLRFFGTPPWPERSLEVSDQAVASPHDEESLAPADLQSALRSRFADLDEKLKASTKMLIQPYASATQRSMLDNEIQQLRLYNYRHIIFDQCNELAKKDQNNASSSEKPDWWSFFTTAKWSKPTEVACRSKAKPKPMDENTFEARLCAARPSAHGSTCTSDIYDQLVNGQYLNVIKNLVVENQRSTSANDLLSTTICISRFRAYI